MLITREIGGALCIVLKEHFWLSLPARSRDGCCNGSGRWRLNQQVLSKLKAPASFNCFEQLPVHYLGTYQWKRGELPRYLGTKPMKLWV